MDGQPKLLLYKLATKAAWPFMYLDTAYWHTLSVSQSQPAWHRSRAQVAYLVYLRAIARETLQGLPAVFIKSNAWIHVEHEYRQHEESHVGDLLNDFYMASFRRIAARGLETGWFSKLPVTIPGLNSVP